MVKVGRLMPGSEDELSTQTSPSVHSITTAGQADFYIMRGSYGRNCPERVPPTDASQGGGPAGEELCDPLATNGRSTKDTQGASCKTAVSSPPNCRRSTRGSACFSSCSSRAPDLHSANPVSSARLWE